MFHGAGFLHLGLLALIGVIVLVTLAIHIVVCFLLQECFRRIPPQFRKQQPALVWLLLIPCFSIVWNFFIYLPLSKSYKAYFDSINRTDVGDCQYGVAVTYSCLYAAFFVPFASLAALVLLIIYLVKIHELKNQIPMA
jgi:hypothetical protein